METIAKRKLDQNLVSFAAPHFHQPSTIPGYVLSRDLEKMVEKKMAEIQIMAEILPLDAFLVAENAIHQKEMMLSAPKKVIGGFLKKQMERLTPSYPKQLVLLPKQVE